MISIEEYIETIDGSRKEAFMSLLDVLKNNIPKGFELGMQYRMPSFYVPLSTYPEGYLCRKDEPLPFISLANQKNYIALYHMGVVADKDLHIWFEEAYKKEVPTKLDMGKSCIRLKNMNHIPYDLIGKLVSKMTVDEWISWYEKAKK